MYVYDSIMTFAMSRVFNFHYSISNKHHFADSIVFALLDFTGGSWDGLVETSYTVSAPIYSHIGQVFDTIFIAQK